MPTIKASISGIRGIVGDGIDIKSIVQYSEAFSVLIKESINTKAKALIAQDTRLTGKMIKDAVCSTLIASGIDVFDIGIAPTPTALYITDKLKLNGAIIVSASHNPIEWNALKLVGKGGRFFSQDQVDTMLKNYADKKSSYVSALKIGTYTKIDNAIEEHVKRIERFIDTAKIKKCGFKVACDYVNGTGLFATPPLLKTLGVKEFAINNENTGRFAHIAEPSKASMKDLSKLVVSSKADIGFTQDPDADRLAIVCEDGRIVSEEYMLALCAKYLLSVGKGDIAVNLSTSRMIDDIAKEHGQKVVRTKIGEINVSTAILEQKLYFGGEGGGGIIVPSVTPGRDSLLGISLILSLMAATKKKVSELIDEIPRYHIEKDKVEMLSINQTKILNALKKKFPKAKITDIDGVKVDFEDRSVHARTSNTEPIVRVIAEAKTKKEALNLIEEVKNIL